MSSKWQVGVLVVSFALILTFQNCGSQNSSLQNAANNQPGVSAQTINLVGTIKEANLDGCGKIVVSNADAKSQFVPRGVDTSGLADGTQVQLIGTIASGVVSSCMAGSIVDVTSLQPIH